MTRRLLVAIVCLWTGLNLTSCGGGSSKKPTVSGLPERVLASQSVTTGTIIGGLAIVNGYNDTIPNIARISAGSNPGLMAISPQRNIVAAFDSSSNTVFAVNTSTESGIGKVTIPGSTSSMVVPTAQQLGYAAVPTANVTGFTFVGAIEAMDFTTGTIASTIVVPNAQTVVANSTGSQLLAFNGTNSVYVINPTNAVPPVDQSCVSGAANSVCTVVTGFDQPVYAVISGSTAYIINCGPECGGTTASVAIFDLTSLTVTNTIPVDAGTWAFLNNSTLYVAGTPPTNNPCTGQQTAATHCGRLDIVNLNSLAVTSSYVITDGTHDRMDLSSNGQLYVGSYDCTNVGNVNDPVGEVRGCLSVLNTQTNSVVIPPDNGDVTGLQGFTSRDVEYVAENGNLRVYDTTKNILLINDYVPLGTINIVGHITDIKAIDFF